jgi:hypothetical protein
LDFSATLQIHALLVGFQALGFKDLIVKLLP